MWSTSFEKGYFHRDTISLFAFTWRSTFGIFLFLFGQPYVAIAMLLCFVGGAAFFFGQKLLSNDSSLQTNRLGILLVFPFIGVWCAAIAGIYPYIGSRHTVFLAPFEIAAASYLLAVICGKKLWVGFLAASLLMVLSNFAPTEEMNKNQSPALMASAVNYMEQSIPRGDHFLLDYQSSIPFQFYFCGPKGHLSHHNISRRLFGFFVARETPLSSFRQWKLLGQTFPVEFRTMAQSHGLKPGDRVLGFPNRLGHNIMAGLGRHMIPRFQNCCQPKANEDKDITITPFVVGADKLVIPSHP